MINFDKWCNDLKEYWLKKDITSIIELFDNQVKYYETPFQKTDNRPVRYDFCLNFQSMLSLQ